LSSDGLSEIFRLNNLRSPFHLKVPFYLVPPIVFSFRADAFFYFGSIRNFLWNDTTVSHWIFRDKRRMNNSNFTISVFKWWILLKPVFVGVDGILHFPVPSMNNLNQTEHATFYNFAGLGFLWELCLSFLYKRLFMLLYIRVLLLV
jgi:hypothetical protein